MFQVPWGECIDEANGYRKIIKKDLTRFLVALNIQAKYWLADYTRTLETPPDKLFAFICSLLPSTQAQRQPG